MFAISRRKAKSVAATNTAATTLMAIKRRMAMPGWGGITAGRAVLAPAGVGRITTSGRGDAPSTFWNQRWSQRTH